MRKTVFAMGQRPVSTQVMGDAGSIIEQCRRDVMNGDVVRVTLESIEGTPLFDSSCPLEQLFAAKKAGESLDRAQRSISETSVSKSKDKKRIKMVNAQFIPTSSIWPDREGSDGLFVGFGVIENDDGVCQDKPTRTSQVLNVDIANGFFETLNTIYIMV